MRRSGLALIAACSIAVACGNSDKKSKPEDQPPRKTKPPKTAPVDAMPKQTKRPPAPDAAPRVVLPTKENQAAKKVPAPYAKLFVEGNAWGFDVVIAKDGASPGKPITVVCRVAGTARYAKALAASIECTDRRVPLHGMLFAVYHYQVFAGPSRLPSDEHTMRGFLSPRRRRLPPRPRARRIGDREHAGKLRSQVKREGKSWCFYEYGRDRSGKLLNEDVLCFADGEFSRVVGRQFGSKITMTPKPR